MNRNASQTPAVLAIRRWAAGLTMLAGATLAPASAIADVPNVVASIKPVHSLTAAVMEGIGEPYLIVKGGGSPHDYALRPSDASALQNADLAVWVDPQMEVALVRPLASLAARAEILRLSTAPGLVTYQFRSGGTFERAPGERAPDDPDEDGTGEGGTGEGAAVPADGEMAVDDAAAGGINMHLWLDPQNAKAMAAAIAEALAKVDGDNAKAYRANAARLAERLDALTAEIEEELAPVKDMPFVVFHDAYRYFEERFGLAVAGSITVSPEVQPSARRVAEVIDKVRSLGATCVFSEPQFQPKLVELVREGTKARAGVLDPLGAQIEDGPELYFALLKGLATSVASCLAGKS